MTSNKRNHERFSYEHQALLVVPGFAPVGCQMANVCAGGMWLSEIASDSLSQHLSKLLSRGQSQWVEVHLFCAAEGGEEHYAIASEVRRSSHDGIGLRFIESQEGLVDTLRVLSRKLGANRLSYVPKSQRARGLEQFIERAEAGFTRLLTIFLARFFAAPFADPTGTGETISAQRKGPPAKVAKLKVIPGKKHALFDLWAESLHQIWRQRLQMLAKPEREAAMLSELSVVDKNQFENWLELQLVTRRISDMYRADIFRLNQYLGHLLRQPVEDRHNPLSPTFLCQLLHDFEEREANLNKTQHTLLNAAFEDTLADNLAPLYQELSELFEQMGLRAIALTSMRASAGSLGNGDRAAEVDNPQAAVAESSMTGVPAAMISADPVAEIGKPGNVVNFLEALSRRTSSVNEAPAEADDGRPSVDSRLLALSALRSHRQQVQSLSVIEGSPLQQIMGQITAGDLGELPHEVTDRLHIVDQVLVPPSHCEGDLQALLLALKGPLAEVLLEDDEFLINPGHPVRRLVNLFFRLINSDSSVSRQSRSLLSEVVQKLAHSIDDTAVIQQLTGRLEESLQRQQRIFEHTAERISRKYEGQDRLQRARVKVGQRLDALFGQSKIPLILDNLLDSGWQHKLVMEVLREGEDGPLVARDLARIKEFSIFLTGIALDTLPPEIDLERAGRKVLKDVAGELRESYKPLEANAAIDELKALLADPSLVEFVQYRSRMPDSDTAESAGEWRDDEGLDRWLDRVAALRPGDWLEYAESGRHMQRLRLVWSDEEAVKFVFITEQGLQEKQMSLVSVAVAMRDGYLTLASQMPPEWIDKCLFQLVNDLYGKMAYQALHDPLTGCIYRHEMEKYLDFCLIRCKTDNVVAALIWLDIDQFRVVNNSYGTAIGDRMLQQTGRLFGAWLESTTGESRLGRMGGNEFALLLYPSDYSDALDKAQTLIGRFSRHEFDFDGVKLFASISAGVILLNADSLYAGNVINRVSLACGVAKSKGGNQVHIYRETDEGQLQQQQLFDWARRIDQMLGENRLNLRAQKIQPAPDQEAFPKYEILLDMPQEDGKQVSPQVFVEAAERLRRSVMVDKWVVHRALEWMRQNPVKLAEISELTINLSGLSMSDDEFLHFLESEFRQGGFPPEKVCFELTETAAVASIQYTADFIRTLRQFSCRFALDDFGTGFSSYAYLQSLPVDYLKIDGIFIRDIDTNMTNYAMVKSITELGQYLGIGVIAECVENQAAADTVIELGVQWLQGWHIEKPRPLDSL
jgi:diguanylate cyclase (GGDEF)-like protein